MTMQKPQGGEHTTTEHMRWLIVAGFALPFVLLPSISASAVMAEGYDGALSVAATPEEAVHQLVVAEGDVYAGACAAARSPEDVGKVCAALAAERGDMRAYLAGRTFSEFRRWVFVERTPSGWRAAGTSPLDLRAGTIRIPWPR